MEAVQSAPAFNPAAVYDRVVREARISFGDQVSDDVVEQAAREAVDELLVRNKARVTTFVPVLAMRRMRESIASRPLPSE